MAHVLVTEANERLEGVAGAAEPRRAILEKGIRRTDRNDPRADGRPRAAGRPRQTHKLLADVSAGLGHLDDALSHRKAALNIYGRLSAAAPNDDALSGSLLHRPWSAMATLSTAALNRAAAGPASHGTHVL